MFTNVSKQNCLFIARDMMELEGYLSDNEINSMYHAEIIEQNDQFVTMECKFDLIQIGDVIIQMHISVADMRYYLEPDILEII